MDTPQDIIQTALDSLGHDVELTIINGSDVMTRYATVITVSNGDWPYIAVENYRTADELVAALTFVGLDELAAITLLAA